MEELFCDKEMDNKEGQKNVLKKKKFCKGIHIKQAQIKKKKAGTVARAIILGKLYFSLNSILQKGSRNYFMHYPHFKKNDQ